MHSERGYEPAAEEYDVDEPSNDKMYKYVKVSDYPLDEDPMQHLTGRCKHTTVTAQCPNRNRGTMADNSTTPGNSKNEHTTQQVRCTIPTKMSMSDYSENRYWTKQL